MLVPIMLITDLLLDRTNEWLFEPPVRSDDQPCEIEQATRVLRNRLTHAEQALRDHPDRTSGSLIRRLNKQIDSLEARRSFN